MDSTYSFRHKSILGIEQLSREDIEHILTTAKAFKEVSNRAIKKVPTLRGRTVINLFFEPSTRTRLSFEVAAKRLNADTFNISASGSSTAKGESLIDTARNIEAMNPDIIILRHACSGAPHLLARHLSTSIINAGDGAHEHPSQALLDMLTAQEHKGCIEGLRVSIIGDITHSRVARSDIIGFTRMGAKVTLAGPATFLPPYIEKMGASVAPTIKDAILDADIIMTLRIQRERQNDPLIPSLREYSTEFGINPDIMKFARKDALLMHPGPINRGVELSPVSADSANSVILNQVTNGVAVRMALLYLVLGGDIAGKEV